MTDSSFERRIVTLRNWDVRYCIIGPRMAIDFHVSQLDGYDVIAGLEMHYKERPSYMRERPADFAECWLTKTPCWCDGTSLYATEWLYPLFKALGIEAFWPTLEAEYRRRVWDVFGEGEPVDE